MDRETLFTIMKAYGINPLVRDEGTLYHCLNSTEDITEQARLVACRHPFVDGNKRAAYLIQVAHWLHILEMI